MLCSLILIFKCDCSLAFDYEIHLVPLLPFLVHILAFRDFLVRGLLVELMLVQVVESYLFLDRDILTPLLDEFCLLEEMSYLVTVILRLCLLVFLKHVD